MRAEGRQDKAINFDTIAGYHRGNHENYMVFSSDRPVKADRTYHLEDGTLPAMFGIEMETECWGIKNPDVYATVLKRICFSVFHPDLWKVESDSTLSGGDCGAECITQPMTKAFIRNNYNAFKAMFESFPTVGVSNTKTGHCGQHVHISLTCFGRTKKTQDEAIRKLYYIVNRHYDLMCALLNRNTQNTHWCNRMDFRSAWTMDLESMSGSHGNCFNGAHYMRGNVELRLPGGQKNFPCFRNTMESVFHLIEACKSISRTDCDDITKVFTGCNQYVYDRLNTLCRRAGTISEAQLATIAETVKQADF